MRLSAIYLVVSTLSLGVTAFDSLSDYLGKIPDCSIKAFRGALENNECGADKINATTFDCICDHVGSIPITVGRDVSVECAVDFSYALAGSCGMWMAEPSKDEQDRAVKILSDKVGGEGGGGSDSDKDSSNGNKDSSDAGKAAEESDKKAEESDKDGAAASARTPGLAGLAGGALAVAVCFLL
jgi:hypothetical protein